jgi:hypothetical protein
MPRQFYETRIQLSQDAIRWLMARRISDPSSAAYMRACVRHAIDQIRADRAAPPDTPAPASAGATTANRERDR